MKILLLLLLIPLLSFADEQKYVDVFRSEKVGTYDRASGKFKLEGNHTSDDLVEALRQNITNSEMQLSQCQKNLQIATAPKPKEIKDAKKDQKK